MTSHDPGPQPLGGEVRVPHLAVKPSVTAFTRAVWDFASGTRGPEPLERNAMSFAPLRLKETGAVHIFDDRGWRVEGSRQLSMALDWREIERVALQVQSSAMLGLKLLRIAFWPVHLDAFVASHPECAVAWDAELGGHAVAVATATQVPQETLDLVRAGLAYAGPRFNGEVEEITLPR